MPHLESTTHAPSDLPFATGDEGTDLVMNGGIPCQSMSLLIGPPGAGKTVLALQVAFAAAQAGRNVVYLTNISESHIRMLQHARNFTFFHEPVIRQNFNLISINSNVQQQGVDATINYIMDVARSARADVLIIDSYLGLKQLFQSLGPQGRNLMFTLSNRLSLLAVTTILLGEYQYDDIRVEPEFAVADAIIELTYSLYELQRRRYLTVIKMRGKPFLEGLHPMLINNDGVKVFPRQESIPNQPIPVSSTEKLSSGVDELDIMLNGGVFARSTTLVAGSVGIGKTLLGLKFLLVAPPDDVGLLISFQESKDQIEQYLADSGLNIGPHLANHLEVLYLSPIELILDQAAWLIRQKIQTQKVRRVVIDTIDDLENTTNYRNRIHNFMDSLIAMLRAHDITIMMIRQVPFVVGQFRFPADDQWSAADTIILMHYLELESHLKRSIAVIKQRGSNHDPSIRQMNIEQGTIIIGKPFYNL